MDFNLSSNLQGLPSSWQQSGKMCDTFAQQTVSKIALLLWLKRKSSISLLSDLNRQYRNSSLGFTWHSSTLNVTPLVCLRNQVMLLLLIVIGKLTWWATWGFNVVLHQLLHKSHSCYILLFLPWKKVKISWGKEGKKKQCCVTMFSPDDFWNVFILIAGDHSHMIFLLKIPKIVI